MSPQNCDPIRAAIAAGRRSARVTSHLLTCSECRIYRRSLIRINQIARQLSNPTPPSFNAARLPAGLPTSGTRMPPMDRRKFVIGAGAAAAAIALGCVVGPRFATPMLFAAEVRTAIAHANTWHFTGWRLEENRRVKWEIWGRRTPFFYREQIGQSLLIATDESRFQIVAPGHHQPRGLAIHTAALAHDPKKSLSNGPESFIEGIGGEFIGKMRVAEQDARTMTLRSPIKRTSGVAKLDDWGDLTVDKQTKLPVNYTLQRAIHADESIAQMETRGLSMPVIKTVELGELAAAYNVPIPADAASAPAPIGYASVDLRQTLAKDDPTVPQAGTATASGITVYPNVLAQDTEGDLHIRFDGWFGKEKVTPDLPCILSIRPMADGLTKPLNGGAATRQMAMIDDNGTGYIEVQNPVGSIDAIHPEWYLVPVEPIRPGQKPPTSLTALASVDASWYEYLPEARTGTTHSLAKEMVQFSTPLPFAPTVLDYDTRPVPHGIRMMSGRVPLKTEAALARAQYYIQAVEETLGMSGQAKSHDVTALFERAEFWADQAREASRTLPGGQPQAVRIQLTTIDQGLAEAQRQMSQHSG